MITEADTCHRYVLPKLYEAEWSDDQISEQKTFTDGKIVVLWDKVQRRKTKRADYILRISRNFPIAVIEAKAAYKDPGDGLQQAKEYAEILGLKFAYSTNGHGIIEHDYITGLERKLARLPTPKELWNRLKENEGITSDVEDKLLTPYYALPGKQARYYQEIAINRSVQAVLKGKRRILLTLATGTGKTYIAFQVIWKLWNARWNRTGEYRKPKVLYLADRNVLIDNPKDMTFSVFGDARWKIKGKVVKSREIYFSTYQAIAKDERRPGLYKGYPQDFFDLIIVDECHRGSARDDSNWREILEYFKPAVQIGMTATPLREDNRDTYKYFGNPIYTYSLKQGIEDGFLAPYRVHRVVSTVDATGWMPYKGQLDKFGREVPDGHYGTKDFERSVSLMKRTETYAKHLTEYLKDSDRFGKTIVFCVDQDHAEQMRMALNNLNTDLVKESADYVVRVVSEEGQIGRGHLDRFMDVETVTPTIVTTSKLLTTGVDVPTCKNIVIFRVVNSMTEFKQIIGRGTRVRDDYGKLFFNILDYTGSATKQFADPDFDGEPVRITEEEIDEEGGSAGSIYEETSEEENWTVKEEQAQYGLIQPSVSDDSEGEPRKYYVDEGIVEIAANLVYELDQEGKRLRVVKYTDYTRKQLIRMYTSAAELKSKWSNSEQRKVVIQTLEERGISFEYLAKVTGLYDADPFDLLCHVAFNAPLRTRRERAEMVKRNKQDFFDRYGAVARAILNEILDKYIEFGLEQLDDFDILKVPPISNYGNLMEIADAFGGIPELRNALSELQNGVYAY
ncbi:MAG: DEAD/DEAH box helicase family protein [Euryarchaeota archaeon]|nr:DEAD/DEAH box helicase family protein [Euryarchaeota archaeon]